MERKPFNLARISLLVLALILMFSLPLIMPGQESTVNEQTFISQANKGSYEKIKAVAANGTVKLTGRLKDSTKVETATMMADGYSKLMAANPTLAGQVVLEPAAQESNSLFPILSMVLSVALGIFMVTFIMRSMNQGGPKSAANFGKSKARLVNQEDNPVTFAQVAGAEEEKTELMEVVDFLKNPTKYQNLGAAIPKGILMVGQPGTGKTLLARAVAGEAGVPFFTISGSDFVEMFVGVGASRVRDLFETAKRSAPCIIFLDEIDAVGRQRGTGFGGGHDEREQTLNQLLVEMDGFEKNSGIVVMAATNRADVLDPALLRPGRFDRQVHIDLPDAKGRMAILKIHTKGKPLGDDVNLDIIAKTTPGFSGAELENLCNEAALLSAREGKSFISMAQFEEARTKVQMGPEKRSRIQTEETMLLTAYHEAGHAIVARSLPRMDPVTEISIIPRGGAGGYTMHTPLEDSSYISRSALMENLATLFGGRCAEELILKDISTGAKSDIDRASKIARAMVKDYGMSERVGNLSFSDHDEVFLGRDMGKSPTYSDHMGDLIDEEVKRIIDEAYGQAESILTANLNTLHIVAKALLAQETLAAYEFEALYSTGELPGPMSEVEIRQANEEVMAQYAARKREEVGSLRNL